MVFTYFGIFVVQGLKERSHCHKWPDESRLDKKARKRLLIASFLCLIFMVGELVGKFDAASFSWVQRWRGIFCERIEISIVFVFSMCIVFLWLLRLWADVSIDILHLIERFCIGLHLHQVATLRTVWLWCPMLLTCWPISPASWLV